MRAYVTKSVVLDMTPTEAYHLRSYLTTALRTLTGESSLDESHALIDALDVAINET